MAEELNIRQIQKFAEEIRIAIIEEIGGRGFGHMGGSMSIVEILSVLYGGAMKIDPANPGWEDRDWLIVSKGHAGPAVYAALALRGFFDREMLKTLNRFGSDLPSHCDRNKTPGIDMTTGSLGQGSSMAVGVAAGNRFLKRDSYTYLILGDGECNEGQVWEAAMSAAHFKLDRLIAFVDHNGQQVDGYCTDVLDMGNFQKKFEAFGWNAQTVDGHNVEKIIKAIAKAKETTGSPSVIVLETKKGHGCILTEGIKNNHHININNEQLEVALIAAKKRLSEIGG